MTASTFCFGLLPLGLRFSKLTLRILEVSGAGLLLGAAGSVVLPEGAGTLFRSEADHHHQPRQGNRRRLVSAIEDAEPETLLAMSFLAGMLLLFVIDQIMAPGPHCHAESHTHDCEPEDNHQQHSQHQHQHNHHHAQQQSQRGRSDRHLSRMSRPESMILTRSNAVPTLRSLERSGLRHQVSSSSTQHGARRHSGAENRGRSPHRASHSPHDSESSVTSLPSDYHTIDHQDNVEEAFRQHTSDSSNKWQSQGGTSPSSPLLAAARSPPASPPRRFSGSHNHGSPHRPSSQQREKARGLRSAFTSIAGLLIHAACDGIAMGASAASQDQGLKLVVLGAIMIHKAPAAFGLCTLLMSQRLARSDIKRAMGIFSLATPVGTLVTYLLLSIFLNGEETQSGASAQQQPVVSPRHVGTALSFSAGSFLYVALDAVHELASSSSDYKMDAHGVQLPKQTLGRTGRIATLLFGATIPKVLQSLFGHGH